MVGSLHMRKGSFSRAAGIVTKVESSALPDRIVAASPFDELLLMHNLRAQPLAQSLRGRVGAGRPYMLLQLHFCTHHKDILISPEPLSCEAQVRSKAQALTQFLQGMAGAGRAYTLLQLARRLLSYCEAQVALSHPSAFPLAEVTAAVLAAHPDLAPILLGKLYEVSAFTARTLHCCIQMLQLWRSLVFLRMRPRLAQGMPGGARLAVLLIRL